MSRSVINHRWMLVLKIFVLFCGILLQYHFCEASGTMKKQRPKNLLFLSTEEIPVNSTFPSDVVFQEENGTRLCFNIQTNQSNADCCSSKDFSCSTKIDRLDSSSYNVTVNEGILLKHDIVVLLKPMNNFSCTLSELRNSTEFILYLDNYLKPGGRNIRMSLDYPCSNQPDNAKTCQGAVKYMFEFGSKITSCVKIVTCEPSDLVGNQQQLNLTFQRSNKAITLQEAVDIMNNFSFYQDQMGTFTTALMKIGDVSGAIVKLPQQNQHQTALNFGFASSGEVKILQETNVEKDLVLKIAVPGIAGKTNDKYIGVLLFPGMPKFRSKRFFWNNKVLGIEMGANVSQTIDIHYSNVEMSNASASCMSWDGKVDNETWTPDHCQTNYTYGNITCRCSHHAFFAVVITSFEPELTFINTSFDPLFPAELVTIMSNLGHYINMMNNASTAAITIGNVTGVIAKLQTNSNMNFGFESSGNAKVLGDNHNKVYDFGREIHLPKQAIDMAQRNNQSYVRVLLFPGLNWNHSNIFKNEVLGIEMGTNIVNLSQTIDIQYMDATMTELKATCMSWDGKTMKGKLVKVNGQVLKCYCNIFAELTPGFKDIFH
ncbi:hypothetical protein XENOCAPTIV_006298 [Xenoophorus captivus]|uniref:GAIN-B domain-containing protein n=1 Tax=Xenoophorus captivus TaxID=1517983 RepID=A0ABV0QRL8_9TELE